LFFSWNLTSFLTAAFQHPFFSSFTGPLYHEYGQEILPVTKNNPLLIKKNKNSSNQDLTFIFVWFIYAPGGQENKGGTYG
jgi:hypothetical protein